MNAIYVKPLGIGLGGTAALVLSAWGITSNLLLPTGTMRPSGLAPSLAETAKKKTVTLDWISVWQ